MKRNRIFVCSIVLVLLAGGIAYWVLSANPPPLAEGFVDDAPVSSPPKKGVPETEEQRLRRLLLGVWHDEYKGKRTMTLNEDGTGVMLVELSGIQAKLFAPKLRFDMKWQLLEKSLKKQTIKGEPADKVNMILNMMGNTAEDKILEVTDDRLLLLDKDGKQQYDWKRVKTEKQ